MGKMYVIITYALPVSVMFFHGKVYRKHLGCFSCSYNNNFVSNVYDYLATPRIAHRSLSCTSSVSVFGIEIN